MKTYKTLQNPSINTFEFTKIMYLHHIYAYTPYIFTPYILLKYFIFRLYFPCCKWHFAITSQFSTNNMLIPFLTTLSPKKKKKKIGNELKKLNLPFRSLDWQEDWRNSAACSWNLVCHQVWLTVAQPTDAFLSKCVA